MDNTKESLLKIGRSFEQLSMAMIGMFIPGVNIFVSIWLLVLYVRIARASVEFNRMEENKSIRLFGIIGVTGYLVYVIWAFYFPFAVSIIRFTAFAISILPDNPLLTGLQLFQSNPILNIVILGASGVASVLAQFYLIQFFKGRELRTTILDMIRKACVLVAVGSIIMSIKDILLPGSSVSFFVYLSIVSTDLQSAWFLQEMTYLNIIGVVLDFKAYALLGVGVQDYAVDVHLSDSEMAREGDNILTVTDLRTYFPIRGGIVPKTVGYVKAVDGVSFSIKKGETLGLVGESGCGKTTIGRTIADLVERTSGTIRFHGMELPLESHWYGKHVIFPRPLRKRIQFIFQDPDASLNPRLNVYDIISEPLRNLNPEMDKSEIKQRVLELLGLVSLNYEHIYRYPHEFSGGQKQRIVIARALACNPEFIILDEPTSALDVSVQAQILNLLKDLQQKFGFSYLFITHNLSVVHHIANRVAVMYLGKLVEMGPVNRIFDNPSHPYTRALLSARSIPDPEKAKARIILKGDVPSAINPPAGCPFNPRCYYQMKGEKCTSVLPKPVVVEADHIVWTSLFEAQNGCWQK